MNRFAHITDLEALTAEWRKEVRRVHPDKGGSEAAFEAAMDEYMQRKAEIEAEIKKAEDRQRSMEYLGIIGACLTKMSKGEDWTQDAAKLAKTAMPQYADDIDLVATLLTTPKI